MTLFIGALFFMLAFTIADLKKAFHMLQQNWYNDGDRYLKWINNNSRFVFLWFDYIYIFISLIGYFIDPNILSIIFIIYYFIITFMLLERYKNEQVKKPLVFTSRIKRMCVTIAILYLIPVTTIFLTFDENLILFITLLSAV